MRRAGTPAGRRWGSTHQARRPTGERRGVAANFAGKAEAAEKSCSNPGQAKLVQEASSSRVSHPEVMKPVELVPPVEKSVTRATARFFDSRGFSYFARVDFDGALGAQPFGPELSSGLPSPFFRLILEAPTTISESPELPSLAAEPRAARPWARAARAREGAAFPAGQPGHSQRGDLGPLRRANGAARGGAPCWSRAR